MRKRKMATELATQIDQDPAGSLMIVSKISGSKKQNHQWPAGISNLLRGDSFATAYKAIATFLAVPDAKIVAFIEASLEELSSLPISTNNSSQAPSEIEQSADEKKIQAEQKSVILSKINTEHPLIAQFLGHLSQNGYSSIDVLLDFILLEYQDGDEYMLGDLEDALQPEGDLEALCYNIILGIRGLDRIKLANVAVPIRIQLGKKGGAELAEEQLYAIASQFMAGHIAT
jgi:hypothetical protein